MEHKQCWSATDLINSFNFNRSIFFYQKVNVGSWRSIVFYGISSIVNFFCQFLHKKSKKNPKDKKIKLTFIIILFFLFLFFSFSKTKETLFLSLSHDKNNNINGFHVPASSFFFQLNLFSLLFLQPPQSLFSLMFPPSPLKQQ